MLQLWEFSSGNRNFKVNIQTQELSPKLCESRYEKVIEQIIYQKRT